MLQPIYSWGSKDYFGGPIELLDWNKTNYASTKKFQSKRSNQISYLVEALIPSFGSGELKRLKGLSPGTKRRIVFEDVGTTLELCFKFEEFPP